MDFQWRDGKPHPKKMQEHEPEVTLNTSNTRTPITQMDPSTGIRAVGFIQSMTGSMKPQLKKLKEQANEWSQHTARGKLD